MTISAKEFPALWSNPPKGAARRRFPLIISVESTNACNLKCVFCNRTSDIADGVYRRVGHMDFGLYEHLVDQFAEGGLFALSLNREGDPLLHPRIVDMVALAKRRGIPRVDFITNGILLTEEMSTRLLDAGLDRITVSVDSPYADRFAALRPGADLRQIRRNVETFHRLAQQRGGACELHLGMIRFHDTTQKEVDDFVRDWRPISDLIGVNKYYIPQRKQRLARFGDAPDLSAPFCCDELWRRLIVLWDGTVLPCCHDLDRALALGDANRRAIGELWNGAEMERLRDLHQQGRYLEIPSCAKCAFRMERTSYGQAKAG